MSAARGDLLTYAQCNWGHQRCLGGEECSELAVLLYDGQPLCFDCAELLLERHIAIADSPGLLARLPSLWEPVP